MKRFEFKTRYSTLFALLGLLAAGAVLQSCNLWGDIDEETGKDEVVSKAKTMIDQEDCGNAVKLLTNFSPKDDEVYQTLGWAQLCAAGATMKKVGNSLFSYNSSNTTSGLTVIGALANNMAPSSQDKVNAITAAIATFAAQSDVKDRGFNKAFGYLIQAAAIMAKSSANGKDVFRNDISGQGCKAADCAAGGTTCTAVPQTGNMSDADANEIGTALVNASAAARESGAAFATDLAGRAAGAGSIAGGAVGAAINRCNIYNNMLSN